MRVTAWIIDQWDQQRGSLFLWAPVFLAAGIGVYFSLKFEPDWMWLMMVAELGALMGLLAVMYRVPLLWAVALVAAGFAISGFRAHAMSAPVLEWRYYGPVEGRIIGMDRSASDALRLTLDQVMLRDHGPHELPQRVRVSLHGDKATPPRPGARVMTTAHLSPPGGPVEPGGFDFQRHAWFQQLGAVGYSRVPVLTWAPPEGGQWLFRVRMAVAERFRDGLQGQAGGFAAAIMTGDRSSVDQDALRALRVSNLAHLLAISGLHMGLLTGLVFVSLRIGLALMRRLSAKKEAAFGAILAAGGYLALSGANVATERAFIMVTVMLFAVILNRRALSLRAVALAGMIVLCLRPEALLSPGFQMSFAATGALVGVFGWMRDHQIRFQNVALRRVGAVVMSSLIAGLATAPVAAVHFNQIAHYGLLANVLSVPVMGAIVMPAGVISLILMPFGIEAVSLWVMGQGLEWILYVANWVSGFENARGVVKNPPAVVLPLIAIGAVVLLIWQGRPRIIGVIPILIGFVMWAQTPRPDILIAETGKLTGLMTDAGRALSREKGSGFIAQVWLENDGDAIDRTGAYLRWMQIADNQIVQVNGAKAAAQVTQCDADNILVSDIALTQLVAHKCRVFTPQTLKKTGAVALIKQERGYKTITARDQTGRRLWNQ